MRIRILQTVALLVMSTVLWSSPFPQAASRRHSMMGFSTSAFGLVSIFEPDLRHADPAKPRAGFGVNARGEVIIAENFRILFGAEFLSQSCSFNSYYFAPGYDTKYDHIYDYTHRLRTYELHLPLLFRVGLLPNESNLNTQLYLLGGYGLKIEGSHSSSITQISSGKEIYNGRVDMPFQNQIIGPAIGNVLTGGIGVDTKFNHSDQSVFFELVYRHALSKYHYLGYNESNDLLIFNRSIALAIGFRI